MQKQQILWFQDSVKFQTDSFKWSRIDELTRELIHRSGHPYFVHKVIDPDISFKHLLDQVNLNHFTSIIDLSGFMTRRLRILTGTPVADNFHLSRVRKLSSHRLDGVGHLVSMTTKELNQLKQSVDLKRPFIIDDICWSGRTAIMAANLLGVDPKRTVFGFLSTNEGHFGFDNKGFVHGGGKFLRDQGFSLVTGDLISTPEDDGFHLKDFIGNKFLNTTEGFSKAVNYIMLREDIKRAQTEDEEKFATFQMNEFIQNNKLLLFPDGIIEPITMRELQKNGKLIFFQ